MTIKLLNIKKIHHVYQYRELLLNLVIRDVKTRSKQSFLGYLWVVINPFFSMVAYTLMVSVFLGVKLTETPYPVFIFCSLLPWNYFASTLVASTNSLVAHTQLVTHVAFPREILPLSALIGPLFDLGISYILLILLMILYSVPLYITILFVPCFLLIQMILTLGLAFILSSLNVYYRDVSYFVGILLRGWMFLSPVVYPLERVPEQYRFLYMLNPMAPLIEGYRQLIFHNQLPYTLSMIYATGVAILVLISGYLFFKRLEPTFSDVI